MRIDLPVLKQDIVNNELVSTESNIVLDIDTSVYSEERWEQNFPELAKREGLFQYIERIRDAQTTDRVRVACMLKAIYCFVESAAIRSYKEFAQMFNLATPEYTGRLISSLIQAFKLIIGSSSVKN